MKPIIWQYRFIRLFPNTLKLVVTNLKNDYQDIFSSNYSPSFVNDIGYFIRNLVSWPKRSDGWCGAGLRVFCSMEH